MIKYNYMRCKNMRRSLKVKIEEYKSLYFPVKAIWKINGVNYCAVFETEKQAKGYFNNRYCFMNVTFWGDRYEQ